MSVCSLSFQGVIERCSCISFFEFCGAQKIISEVQFYCFSIHQSAVLSKTATHGSFHREKISVVQHPGQWVFLLWLLRRLASNSHLGSPTSESAEVRSDRLYLHSQTARNRYRKSRFARSFLFPDTALRLNDPTILVDCGIKTEHTIIKNDNRNSQK